MLKKIPYSKQNIVKKDIISVNKILKSDFLTSGPTVEHFEKKISKEVNSKYAVATNSATSALHIACLSLGLKKNDIIWTSSISFVASANCAKYCGARVEFLDISFETFNIDTIKLLEKLKEAKKKKILPKILIPVHLAGNPCDMRLIHDLSKKYKFKIIEDASHALGAKINNFRIGSCKYSDLTVFSFHPVKMITTGEGGIITTNNYKTKEKLKILREHGIVRQKKKFKLKYSLDTHYEQHSLGYNYRMSDIHAALGISQIDRLNSFVKKRNLIKNFYLEKLKNLPIKFQKIDKKNLCSYHLIIIIVSQKIRNKLFNYLKNKNININIHYIPIFIHPYYFRKKYLKNINSINYYNSAISLPAFYDITKAQLNYVVNQIRIFFKKNVK